MSALNRSEHGCAEWLGPFSARVIVLTALAAHAWEMVRPLVPLPVLFAWGCVAASSTVNGGCLFSQSCTEIGCMNSASLNIHESDWTLSPLQLVLSFGDRTVRCDAVPTGSGKCDDASVWVDAVPLADCVETRTKDAISESCTPNGKYQYVVIIQELTPARVSVTATRADSSTVAREFELVYERHRPNGPDCEPECENATVEWELGN